MAGIDANTVFCSHFDGADEATAATDSSYAGANSPHTITFVGTAQLATAQKKFGTASLLLDGNSDYLTVANHTDFVFGTGDFTIDCWVYLANRTNEYAFISKGAGTSSADWSVKIDTSGNIVWGTSDANYASSGTVVAATTWTHVAITRSGGTHRMFVGGTQVYSATRSNNYTTTTDVHIGRRNGATQYYFNGNIDELRISKGIARWTANFTPPTLAYSRDAIRSHAIIL